MSRTIAFGRDVLGAPDVDIEDLLAMLSPAEVQNLLDEFAADPDDKHLPASVRTAYRCEKDPTGDLDRNSLINYINEIAIKTPDAEENVKFELGVKRGKIFTPTYSEEEMAAMQKKEEIADSVKLDPDEEDALANADLEDIMTLAEIVNTNPQDFIMEAYADPLKFYEPDPPNTTDPKEVQEKLKNNDNETKDVCLNNISGISEADFCDMFETLRTNQNLTKFSAVNCDVNDFSVATLCAALEQNHSLKSINLENNRITPDQIAELFETIASPNNGLIEVRVASQAQEKMGYRVEDRIATAISNNSRLVRLGITFEFPECETRVSRHLINNVDNIRQKRLKDGVEPGAGAKWTAARTID